MMKIKEFYEKYDLHDSVIEDLEFKKQYLTLKLRLCNWRQKNYKENESEILIINIIFENVKKCSIYPQNKKFSCDSILKFELVDKTKMEKLSFITIVTEDDSEISIIEFYSDNVEIKNW